MDMFLHTHMVGMIDAVAIGFAASLFLWWHWRP